jgi:hypothetical protein
VTDIKLSICAFSNCEVDVMIRDSKGRELIISATRTFTDEEMDMINEIAPACVWTPYVLEDKIRG